MSSPYPLLFEPILKPKVWGGRALARFGRELPPSLQIGESWDLADLATTSEHGGGGGPARSVVSGGPLAGSTLADAMARWGDGLMGLAQPATTGGFPLLVKLLDARENLSVQVHPDEAWAQGHPEEPSKHEAWYVLDADPGARLWRGVRPGRDRHRLAEDLRAGRLLRDLLEVPAVAGEMHDLPGGTIHALGAGVRVVEIQTPGDTTFRLYDWAHEYDRPSRRVDADTGLLCASLSPPPPPRRLPAGRSRAELVRAPGFTVTERLVRGEDDPVAGDGSRPVVLVVVQGELALDLEGPVLPVGTTCLVPAALAAVQRLRGAPSCRVLVVEVG